MRKIKTPKYVIYKESGQVYKNGVYFRTLTVSQFHYLNTRNWNSLALKKKLDSLIDDGDKEWAKVIDEGSMSNSQALREMLKGNGSEIGSDCTHKYNLLEIIGAQYRFFCTRCLIIEARDRDAFD